MVEIHYCFQENGVPIFAICLKGNNNNYQFDETNTLFMGNHNECMEFIKNNNYEVIG